MSQTPRGPDNMMCPLHKAKMSKVCHTCPLWMQVRGQHPNTGEQLDKWNCALAWGPVMAMDAARNSNQTTAAVEGLRNVVATNKQRSEAMPLRLASSDMNRPMIDATPKGKPRRLT